VSARYSGLSVIPNLIGNLILMKKAILFPIRRVMCRSCHSGPRAGIALELIHNVIPNLIGNLILMKKAIPDVSGMTVWAIPAIDKPYP